MKTEWNYKTFLNSRQFWGKGFSSMSHIINTRIPSPNPTQYQWLLRSLNSLRFRAVGGESLSDGSLQCERDFRPLSIRRKSTSMPPFELSLLIQPWVLLRLMFLGWYSVPLFLVRTCWYCHAGCWNTPEPSACEDIGPHLEIRGALDLGTIQLLNSLRWEMPIRFPTGMLLKEHWLKLLFFYMGTVLQQVIIINILTK